MKTSFFRRIIDDYHVTMFLGVMLVFLGVIESLRNIAVSILGVSITSPYILMGLGLFNVVLAVAFFVMGARSIEAAEEAAHPERHPCECESLKKRIEELERRLAGMEKAAEGRR